MRIVLNGADAEIDPDATVTDIIERLGRGGPRRAGLAVARNGEVVARGNWDSTRLQPDDRVEVLGAVQGG